MVCLCCQSIAVVLDSPTGIFVLRFSLTERLLFQVPRSCINNFATTDWVKIEHRTAQAQHRLSTKKSRTCEQIGVERNVGNWSISVKYIRMFDYNVMEECIITT